MRGQLSIIQLTTIATALCALTAPAQAQSQGSWATKAPLPAALNEVSLAVVGGKVHVIGGSVLGFTGPYHLEYDPPADTWRARSPFPNRLDHVGSAVLNGKIYTVGGFVGGGVHKDGQDVVYEYDPASDTWRTLANLKLGRGSVGVVAVDGKIHAIGGRGADGKTVGTHDIYDPKSNTWTAGPPLPTPRSGLAGTVYKGVFMVLGGEMPDQGRTNAENEAFDSKTNSWRTLAPMPDGRHATGAATDGAYVYLAGGSLKPGGGGVTNQLIVFTLP